MEVTGGFEQRRGYAVVSGNKAVAETWVTGYGGWAREVRMVGYWIWFEVEPVGFVAGWILNVKEEWVKATVKVRNWVMSSWSTAFAVRKQTEGKTCEIFLRVYKTGGKDLGVFSKHVSWNDEITQVCRIDKKTEVFLEAMEGENFKEGMITVGKGSKYTK